MSAPTGGQDEILVTVCGRTHRGRVRRENQDRFLVADLGDPSPDGSPADDRPHGFAAEFALGREGAILLVADGMGGRKGGARASGIAASVIRESMIRKLGPDSGPTTEQFIESLKRSLEAANAAIHAEGAPGGEYEGMGTTATLAGLLGGFVYVAQVGDSRAYLARGERIVRLTRDQSLVQDLIDSGLLSQDEAQNLPDNRVLQALGVAPTVRPAVTFHRLRRGDVVVLCSDGLCQMVSDDEIGAVAAEGMDGVAACDILIGMANSRGGPDNITVLMARLDGAGIEEAGDTDVVAQQSYERA